MFAEFVISTLQSVQKAGDFVWIICITSVPKTRSSIYLFDKMQNYKMIKLWMKMH